MDFDTRYTELRVLRKDVLAEVVKEGETLLASQLQVASSADQRAMSFAGALVASITASIGATVAVMLGTADRDAWLVMTGIGYSSALATSAGLAFWSAKPGPFCFPGNEPKGWIPSEWHSGPSGPHDLNQARIEQAKSLQSQIGKNKLTLASNASFMKWSMAIMAIASVLAILSILLWWSNTPIKSKPTEGASKISISLQLLSRGQGSERNISHVVHRPNHPARRSRVHPHSRQRHPVRVPRGSCGC